MQQPRWAVHALKKEYGDDYGRCQYGSHPHTGHIEQRMGRGTGMALAGQVMLVVKGRRVNLASYNRPHGQTDE
jgi:hypothetical protein